MDLEKYLLSRNHCNNVIMHLNSLIECYDTFFINSLLHLDMNDAEYIMEQLNFLQMKEQFNSNLKYHIEIKKQCESRINNLCEHDFIDDYIDITPDHSQKITYCKICNFTK